MYEKEGVIVGYTYAINRGKYICHLYIIYIHIHWYSNLIYTYKILIENQENYLII